MDIPEAEQYTFLTSHLQYIDDKMTQIFSLFTTLATAIAGGVYHLSFKLDVSDPRRESLAVGMDWLVGFVGAFIIISTANYLRSWHGYRSELCRQYPSVPTMGQYWWLNEALMCILVVLGVIFFWIFNPLKT